ncbi:reverse transcriptase zinc-binding domain-containing protein [Tanacetum coccineum]
MWAVPAVPDISGGRPAYQAAGKETKWLRNLILEIPLWSKPIAPISIRCDNAATLAKAYSQMYNGKSRYLGVADEVHNLGHLFKFISRGDLYDARLKDDMTVSEMISNGHLAWPEEWYEKFPEITHIACPALDTENTDKIVWRDRNGKDWKFYVSIAYSDMNIHYPRIPWWKLIWFSQCIPKHSFIVWLAIQDRLTTQDKLDGGDNEVNRCCLCCQASEDIKHLMFQCPFSRDLWIKVKGIVDIEYNRVDLMDITQFLIDAGNGNNIKSIIRRVAFSASIYNIWQERNGRIFRDVKRSCEDVFNKIVDTIKHRLLIISHSKT